MSRFFIDLGPLRRFPYFRMLWTGYAVRQLGAQLTTTTVIYQIFVLTHSNLDVGLLSLVQLGPSLLFPIVGGAIADAVDRRKLLAVMAVLLALCPLGLALNSTGGHPALWVIFVLSGASSGFAGIDGPTRTAVTMNLVDRESIVGANVLRSLLADISSIAGPGIAGVLIALFHGRVAQVYWIDVGSTAIALQAVVRLPPLLPGSGGRKFSLNSIAEGFRYIQSRQVIQGCFVADIIATTLGEPVSLFPYMALMHFHGGAMAFGLLSAGPAIGAGLGGLVSGWTGRVRRQGRAVLVAVAIWGAAIVLFGFAPWLWLGIIAIALAGWADATSVVFRSTILQLEVPDRLRGRLSSIETAVVTSAPRLGNAEGGLVAAVSSAPIAIYTGGLACIVGIAIMAKLMPRFATYDIASATGLDKPPSTDSEGGSSEA